MVKIIEIKNLTKKFGENCVLDDISFEIEEGDFVFITGVSGAGKTTFLKLILGEITADSGELLVDGENIADIKLKNIAKFRQKFGVVFQDYKVLPEETVKENVEIALAVIGLPNEEWEARIEHVLDLVGLKNKSEVFPSQLSGGEMQRLSMARALVVNPKIILADEPTGNLDWETAEKIMDLFEIINKEGKTIIMATHNQSIIEKHKKRVIKIKDGKVVNDSTIKKKS